MRKFLCPQKLGLACCVPSRKSISISFPAASSTRVLSAPTRAVWAWMKTKPSPTTWPPPEPRRWRRIRDRRPGSLPRAPAPTRARRRRPSLGHVRGRTPDHRLGICGVGFLLPPSGTDERCNDGTFRQLCYRVACRSSGILRAEVPWILPRPRHRWPSYRLQPKRAEAPSPALSTSTPVVAHAASASAPLQLVIRAREDSWLSVSVDGEIVTRALLTAPAQKSIRAQNEIVVRAGNVGALDFEFNGKKLPTQGDYGEAKTLIFDAHGLQPPAPKPEAPKPEAPKPEVPAPSPQ